MLNKAFKTGVSSLKKPTKLKEPASTLMRIVGLLLGALLTVIGFVALSYYPEDGWLQLLGGLGFYCLGWNPCMSAGAGEGCCWYVRGSFLNGEATPIGVSLYIRAEAVIPLTTALMSKGLGAGVVLAIIIGGLTELLLLRSLFMLQLLDRFRSDYLRHVDVCRLRHISLFQCGF